MFSYIKNFMPGNRVNDIPLSAIYTGILSNTKKTGNISINLKTGMVTYGGFTSGETKVNPIISGLWGFLKAKKKIPENIQNIVRKPETDPFRKSIVEYITTKHRLLAPDVDLPPEDSKRWQDWLKLLESNKEEFFSDKPELKAVFENNANAENVNAENVNAENVNANNVNAYNANANNVNVENVNVKM